MLMLAEYFYIQLQRSLGLLLPLENTTGVITLTPEQICPIPGVAPALLGVANQRGKLLWVVELSNLLGLARPSNQVRNSYNLTLVVLTASSVNSTREQAERQIGCVVSALKGIVALNPQQFKPVPVEFSPSLSSYLSGVAEIEQSQLAILNVNAVFTALSNLDPSLVAS